LAYPYYPEIEAAFRAAAERTGAFAVARKGDRLVLTAVGRPLPRSYYLNIVAALNAMNAAKAAYGRRERGAYSLLIFFDNGGPGNVEAAINGGPAVPLHGKALHVTESLAASPRITILRGSNPPAITIGPEFATYGDELYRAPLDTGEVPRMWLLTDYSPKTREPGANRLIAVPERLADFLRSFANAAFVTIWGHGARGVYDGVKISIDEL
jgi:hypothetical protein